MLNDTEMQPLEGFKGADCSEQVLVVLAVLAVVIDKGDAELSRLAKNLPTFECGTPRSDKSAIAALSW